jgi:hypothetical protein
MKKDKIIYWIATGIIFLFEGVMPALTGQSEMAKEGIRHLGYPEYFGLMLVIFKVIGAIVLIVPQFPARIKEWAYAGFGISLICAFVSNGVVDGFGPMSLFPVAVFGILALSYIYYHKTKA